MEGSKTERIQVAALASLADALTGLATRFRAHGVMSADFIRLTARAKTIAGQAWEVRTSRWAFEENAARLTDALGAFAEEARAAADRTLATVIGDAGVVEALLAHADRIGQLRDPDAGSARQVAIRAELRPLEATLVALQARIGEERQVVDDAAALARGAAALATRALGLRHGGRAAEAAAQDIHAALTAFMEDATAVSRRIEQSAQGLGEDAARMASGTRVVGLRRVDGFIPGLVWSHS